jgi:predicted nucleotide-binding protein
MFYHIIIERNEKIGKTGKYETLYEFDNQNLEKIKSDLVIPYKNNNQIIFKGYPLEKKDIRRFAIKSSEKSADEIKRIQQSKVSSNVLFFWQKNMVVESDELVTDITSDVLKSVEKNSIGNKKIAKEINMSKIFIVHGHDDSMKLDVARFIEKLGFEVIILHEQANAGLTIIEKIEKFSDTGYGIVLYSPCDVGSKNEKGATPKLRARQNVVFEHGYLIGKLGRNKVAALVKDEIELPSDTDGVVYISYDDADWRFKICKELKNAGYKVDMNLL